MLSLFNPRRIPHHLLCTLLAALMALGPIPAVAQEQQKQTVPPIIGGKVEIPQQPEKADDDKTLLADPATTGAAAAPLEVAYAVPNTCVLVALRPAQLLSSPMAELYPTEVMQAAGLQHLGIDPLAAESVVFALAPTVGGPPCYSALIRFNKPFELKASELTAHTTPAEVAGHKYLQSKDPMLPSLCPLDEQSLLVAPDYFLRNLVSNKPATRVDSFAAAFAAADRGDDLLAMVDVAPLRALINMGTSKAPIPPEFASARELPNLVRFFELRANLSRPAPSSALITANNEADAKRIVDIANEMKQLLVAKWSLEAQKQLASDDPVEQAAGRYSLRMSRLVDDRFELQREKDSLILFRGDLTGQGGNPLATVAAMGVLVALLLPAVQAAREAARRNASVNNMRQIMLALLIHESDANAFPAYANFDAAGKPLLSWRVHMLPHLDQQALYQRFRLDEPWDSEHNKQLIPLMPEVYLDPSSGRPAVEGKTNYLGVRGEARLFDGTDQGRQLKDIEDGTSNTIAVVQVGNDRSTIWTRPDDILPDAAPFLRTLGLIHPGGFVVGRCDGSVEFIPEDVDPAQFQAMLTISGSD
jgi:hypothetical protein